MDTWAFEHSITVFSLLRDSYDPGNVLSVHRYLVGPWKCLYKHCIFVFIAFPPHSLSDVSIISNTSYLGLALMRITNRTTKTANTKHTLSSPKQSTAAPRYTHKPAFVICFLSWDWYFMICADHASAAIHYVRLPVARPLLTICGNPRSNKLIYCNQKANAFQYETLIAAFHNHSHMQCGIRINLWL